MRTITASNARQGFAELLESLDQGPVLIERQRRGVAVVMSVNEYWRLRQADSASQAWAPDQTVTRHAGSTWILEEAEGAAGASYGAANTGAAACHRMADNAAVVTSGQRAGRKRQMGTLKGQLTTPEDFDRWLEDEIHDLFAGKASSDVELLRTGGKTR